MAISKKQLGVIGAIVAVAAIVGGGAAAFAATRAADPAAADAAPSAAGSDATGSSIKTADVKWVEGHTVPAAVEALRTSGFTPVEPGKLTVAVAPFQPPLAFIPEDSQAAVGHEVNFAKLVAQGLGLEYNQVITSWADWPLGAQSGKFDLVISNVTVTEERKELYDFATYREDLLGFYVKSDSAIASIQGAEDISGLRIIVGSGTNQEQVLLEWNSKLEAEGKQPAELQYYDDVAAAALAVQSGRADATFGPNASGAWSAANTGQTKLVGTVPGGWPLTAEIGAVTAKGNGLIGPVNLVIQDLIATGTYGQLLDAWGLAAEGIPASQINPPGLPKK